jgi:signal transduction histidine kinase
MIAGIGAIEARSTYPDQRAALKYLHELAAQTPSEVHDVSRTLRPTVLDDLALVAAVEKHRATMSKRFAKPILFHSDGWDRTERN